MSLSNPFDIFDQPNVVSAPAALQRFVGDEQSKADTLRQARVAHSEAQSAAGRWLRYSKMDGLVDADRTWAERQADRYDLRALRISDMIEAHLANGADLNLPEVM